MSSVGGGTEGGGPREIVIPFDPTPTVGFAVYFRQGGEDALPDADRLKSIVSDWLQAHAYEPLLSGIRAFVGEGLVTFLVRERGNPVPDPPDEMVRAYNPGETEERRYRNATHVVFVGATDWVAPPRVGFWAVVAAARALAQALPGGVLIDPEFPRLLPLSDGDMLPAHGEIHIVQHILLPYSQDKRTGLLWMTTKGMSRFGLPDLEIRDVPPNLAQNLMPVINGMAQKLMAAATAQNPSLPDLTQRDEDEDDALAALTEIAQGFPCPSEIQLSVDDIARAYGDPDETEDSDEPDEPDENTEGSSTSRSTPFRLTVSRQRGGGETVFIRLLPPRATRSDGGSEPTPTGVWLNQVLSDLFGDEANLAAVEPGDEQMEAAHNHAVSLLPQIRARFGNGFRNGEVLHVKYGFPVDNATGEAPPPDSDDSDDFGHEFMWIAVTSWSQGGRMRGNLANDPQYRRDLKAGQVVEISEEDIYDWMIVHPGGRHEGAFTNAVLESLDAADDESSDE